MPAHSAESHPGKTDKRRREGKRHLDQRGFDENVASAHLAAGDADLAVEEFA